ncbi:MAG: sugar transferase [Sediminibacterium sp.]
MNQFFLRLFDLILSVLGVLIFSPLFLILLIIGYFDTGSPIFFQERVGQYQKKFFLMKFRSMDINTQSIATHLIQSSSITKWGAFLRKTKLDELPQILNVLKGEMSFVGPRPNLFSQSELIEERSRRNIYSVCPGITGLAQIKKIDMSAPHLLAETDAMMIAEMNVLSYFKYILLTVSGSGFGDRVKY